MTHALPAATALGIKPERSLDDHSKTAAALATAPHCTLALATQKRQGKGSRRTRRLRQSKILLVQGNFFGIQDFRQAAAGNRPELNPKPHAETHSP